MLRPSERPKTCAGRQVLGVHFVGSVWIAVCLRRWRFCFGFRMWRCMYCLHRTCKVTKRAFLYDKATSSIETAGPASAINFRNVQHVDFSSHRNDQGGKSHEYDDEAKQRSHEDRDREHMANSVIANSGSKEQQTLAEHDAHAGGHVQATSLEQQIRDAYHIARSRVSGAVDRLAGSGPREETPQQVARRLAVEAMVKAQSRAVQTGETQVLTADHPGLERLYAENLRNERVPVVAASPSDSWDWAAKKYTQALPVAPVGAATPSDVKAWPRRLVLAVQHDQNEPSRAACTSTLSVMITCALSCSCCYNHTDTLTTTKLLCRWSWKQWALWSVTPIALFVLYWIYFVEWYRWRYGYYHIHQAVDELRSGDVDTVWTAVDRVSNFRIGAGCTLRQHWTVSSMLDSIPQCMCHVHQLMVQRPHWRRRAAQSGVVYPLVDLLEPGILEVRPTGLSEDIPASVAGYNFLMQVLLTINWIVFDEIAEQQIRASDLDERLREAIDGPDRWIRKALPRAVARNILAKLDNPPLRPYLGTGWQRVQGELREFWEAFPELPERHSSAAYYSGLRGDDPMMGWRGQKIMAVNEDVLLTPGIKRRIARWRSWWNKHELYPPSVDRWLRQRDSFFEQEREHANQALNDFRLSESLNETTASLRQGNATAATGHIQRGFFFAFCRPLRILESQRRS